MKKLQTLSSIFESRIFVPSDVSKKQAEEIKKLEKAKWRFVNWLPYYKDSELGTALFRKKNDVGRIEYREVNPDGSVM